MPIEAAIERRMKHARMVHIGLASDDMGRLIRKFLLNAVQGQGRKPRGVFCRECVLKCVRPSLVPFGKMLLSGPLAYAQEIDVRAVRRP
jgi:hypothetical protein